MNLWFIYVLLCSIFCIHQFIYSDRLETPCFVFIPFHPLGWRPNRRPKRPRLPTVGQDVRLDNRIIDLRTVANQAIFRLQRLGWAKNICALDLDLCQLNIPISYIWWRNDMFLLDPGPSQILNPGPGCACSFGNFCCRTISRRSSKSSSFGGLFFWKINLQNQTKSCNSLIG